MEGKGILLLLIIISSNSITSIVLGDYDGNVFIDILVTTHNPSSNFTHVHIIWDGIGTITCSNETEPRQRVSWVNRNRTKTKDILMEKFNDPLLVPIKTPYSNLFLDLNDDYLLDLMITMEEAFEIWHGISGGFKYLDYVPELDHRIVSRRLARPEDQLYRCKKKELWGFEPPDKWKNVIYTDAITLPTGDLNMGGYTDLLAMLRPTRVNGRECFCYKMLNAKFAKESVAL
ncbi:hypothetical protein KQX54_016408 [Cotesia glomerata]|uniref:Uncharacterized protein n=1 Tax=Cotesia glomerata TaxID=32391 RepID=A0AAV7IQS9_COTGL|nr:hypothetical protein KQX54_016408 [Cotesia glomerata]